MCSHICQARTRLELHSSTFPFCVSTVDVRDSNGVPYVQDATCFSCHAASVWRLDSLQPLDHEFLLFYKSNSGRRVLLLSQQLCNNKISTQHCRGSATMVECPLWRKGCNGMCVLALSWCDEVSAWHSINIGVHAQSVSAQTKTRHAPSTLGLETWSRCQLRCSSSKLSVILKKQRVGFTT